MMTHPHELTADQLVQRLHDLRQMSQHPGWLLYSATQEASELAMLEQLTGASTPHDMAKAAGALQAVRSLRSWLRREITMCQETLKLRNETPVK